jgi:hypothetical protein
MWDLEAVTFFFIISADRWRRDCQRHAPEVIYPRKIPGTQFSSRLVDRVHRLHWDLNLRPSFLHRNASTNYATVRFHCIMHFINVPVLHIRVLRMCGEWRQRFWYFAHYMMVNSLLQAHITLVHKERSSATHWGLPQWVEENLSRYERSDEEREILSLLGIESRY